MLGPPFSFTDADGMEWTVTEYGASGSGANTDSAYLVFESDGTVRRVRAFPENWRSLTSVELTKLSWMR